MWRFQNAELESEVLQILRDQKAPIGLEQIVHQLFHRRHRITDLLVLSRSSIRRKQGLKRQIERCLERGIAERTLVHGQPVFTLRARPKDS